jgi:cold shock CspA family protein
MNTTSTARFNGTLKKWNDERGFGFLVAEHGGQELFVHVSAFPRGGRPPMVGEALSFEVEPDKDGRKRAVRVRRPGDAEPRQVRHHDQARPRGRSSPPRRAESNSWVTSVIGLLLLAGAGWYAYGQYSERVAALPEATPQSVMNPEPWTKPRAAQPNRYQCDGRQHCSQMTSCEEAKFFIRNCPDTKMDGDRDGVPCEQQLCTGIFGGSGVL